MNSIPDNYSPSVEEVMKFIDLWNHLDNYVNQEHALDKLFMSLCPSNDSLENILIKCSTLNDFYSTNIFDVHSVANHIWKIKGIDERLEKGDSTLVNEIAHVKVGTDNTPRLFYSFATKYCSHHQPLRFAIYDTYVEKVLTFFKKRDGFSSFRHLDLKNYNIYIKVIKDFKQFYGLQQFSYKQLDQYLWLLGKNYYKKY